MGLTNNFIKAHTDGNANIIKLSIWRYLEIFFMQRKKIEN